MKPGQGARRAGITFLLTAAMVAMLGSGVAHAAYGQVSEAQAQQYAAMASDALGAQQQQQPAQVADPISAVQRIRIRSDAIIVTYSDKNKKGRHRTLVIDYSELVPGTSSTKAGARASGGISGMASGLTGGLPTGTLMKYGIIAMIFFSFVKRLRRVVRRVTRV